MIREGVIIPDIYKSNDTLIERAENIRKIREYFQNTNLFLKMTFPQKQNLKGSIQVLLRNINLFMNTF